MQRGGLCKTRAARLLWEALRAHTGALCSNEQSGGTSCIIEQWEWYITLMSALEGGGLSKFGACRAQNFIVHACLCAGCCIADSDGTPTIMYTGVRLRSNPDCGPLPPQEHDLNLPFIESQLIAVPESGALMRA